MKRAFAGLLAAGAVAGALAATTAPASAALPDGRAWELVSPLLPRATDYENGWYVGDDNAIITTFNDLHGVYLSRRTDSGWKVERVSILAPAATVTYTSTLLDVTDDLTRLLVRHALPASFSTDQLQIRDSDGSWARVGGGVAFQGASAGLDRVVVKRYDSASDPYPGVESGSGVWLWDDGDVSSVGDDLPRAAICGADVGDGRSTHAQDQSGVSADGDTIVLTTAGGCTDPDDPSVSYLPHVVVWHDGESVDVSEPVAGADAAATYVGNAADGSAVFFTSAAQLTGDDANGVSDLFRYDVADGELERLSADATSEGDGVSSAIASDDGTTAWYATSVSATRDALSAWTLGWGSHVVTLGTTGSFAFSSSSQYQNTQQSQITPDGWAIAWPTTGRVGAFRGGSAQIVRVTLAGEVDCVSCKPGGVAGQSADFGLAQNELTAPTSRISDDGSEIAFETAEALSEDDGNGRVDVYAWNEETGETTLLVDPAVDSGSNIGGVSPRGDVFVRTRAALLPWLHDDRIKVYDARVGSGFPAPADPTANCPGDSCQGTPQTPATPAAPGSETFSGAADADDPEQAWAPDPAVTFGTLSKLAQRRLAGRSVVLPLRANAAGRVSATVRAWIGKRWVRVGGAVRTAKHAGGVKLSVKLDRRARRALATHRTLRVQVVAEHGAGTADVTRRFVLKLGRGR